MIRINLLAPERTKARSKAVAGPAAAGPGTLPSVLLLLLFVGGALVLCAGAWWLQTNTLKNLDDRIAADQQRQAQLQAIKLQVDEFQRKKAILENKVAVIERLRLAQKSPVHMLDEISKALPDYVWLNTMDETKGSLRFGGESNSLAAVADFISGLQRTGWFPQVDLAGAQEQANLVKFELTGTFSDPDVAAREAKERAKRPPAAGSPPAAGAR
jgi:type IV pilus assembly protein PilN